MLKTLIFYLLRLIPQTAVKKSQDEPTSFWVKINKKVNWFARPEQASLTKEMDRLEDDEISLLWILGGAIKHEESDVP